MCAVDCLSETLSSLMCSLACPDFELGVRQKLPHNAGPQPPSGACHKHLRDTGAMSDVWAVSIAHAVQRLLAELLAQPGSRNALRSYKKRLRSLIYEMWASMRAHHLTPHANSSCHTCQCGPLLQSQADPHKDTHASSPSAVMLCALSCQQKFLRGCCALP